MSTKTTAEGVSARKTDVKKLTVLGLFIAIGYIFLSVFRFKVQYLTLDFKDVFITMAGFIYGPAAAFSVAFIETILELVTVASTGFWGAIMNVAGSATFACTASLIYKYNKSFNGAVVGLCTSVFVTTAIMMPMNLLITPLYAHTDFKTVMGLIPTLLLPFNFIKSLLNAAVTFVLYKPLTQALRSIRVIPKSSSSNFKGGKKTVVGYIISALLIAAAVAVLLIVFKGQFEMVKPAK